MKKLLLALESINTVHEGNFSLSFKNNNLEN
jgi:hypothetical protein